MPLATKSYWDLMPDALTAHQQKWGGPNDQPPGWREVDEAYIAQRSTVRSHDPMLVEYRTVRIMETRTKTNRKPRETMQGLKLQFFWDETGCAIYYDYWGQRVRWFVFGCEHDPQETSRPAGNRSGEHGYTCKKCGFSWTVDTSD